MAKIPVNTYTTENMIENGPDIIEDQRSYLGMSGLGGECIRKLWYGFRWASPKIISIRTKRIFERGSIEESRIIKDLKKVGLEVFRRDEGGNKIEIFGNIGEKQEELTSCWGHAKGHPDGRCLGVIESPNTEHGLEMKTMNDSYFKDIVKNKLKLSSPVYYSQCQRYMKAMKLDRFLFIATNKNDERRYYERVKYDSEHAEKLVERERLIVISEVPVGEKFSRAYFACKMCNQYDVCHNDAPPMKTCRSCEYSDLIKDGKWICDFQNGKVLTEEEQKKACNGYRRSF